MASKEESKRICWYVMRDLKRTNAKKPAYKQFNEKHIEVFTPMKWCLKDNNGKQVREKVPFIQDLLFVHDSREVIDPIVQKIPTIQYRYCKGGEYRKPMIVNETDMERFIQAVNASDNPKYYLTEEITPEMCRHKIRIISGKLNGYEGFLLSVRGSKVKRLLVQLPEFFSVGVEVNTDMIEFI
ncbi:UpxY family transcription antiterminator [Bacteroides sp.]|uniref:UpxY family transcription antiterminator n=1 Tax=Bacteroides sp. TaxID=29523 RepID=UPI00263A2DB7|nr:UpxY family transcription antiterminator [Bacteroides sp.]MDD3038776.1 UpxY family transcription antiterminator [Bacteroides sp.]